MAIGMAVSAISKAVNQAKRTRSKRNKPTAKVATPKQVPSVNSDSTKAKATAYQNQYDYKTAAAKQMVQAAPKPVKGVASVGSTGGSPKPATPTATNDQYKYDLQAWKQSKKALRGS